MVINDWLSTNVDSGEGNKKVTLTSTPNNTDEDRVTTLVVKGKNKSVSVNVRQLKQSESFVFYVKHYSNIPVSGTNADRVLSVFSCNKPCTLIRYDIYTGQDLGMDFVTEETLKMAEGINNIYLNAESNIVDGVTNPIRFVAYVIVYEGKSYGYFPIAQLGIDPTITVTPNEVEFHKYGGTTTIEITANTNWRIGGDNYKPQITFSKTFGKSGTYTINVTAQEYEGIEDLIYNLWVGVGIDVSVPLVIKQDSTDIPQDCFYIEPIDNEVNIYLGRNTIIQYYSDSTTLLGDYIYYCDGKEWKIYFTKQAQGAITINKKTYFKDWLHKEIDGKVNSLMGNGKYRIGGNIETLLGEMREDYAYLAFSSPNLVDASKLILPHTTISSYAYYNAFRDCINLVTAPQLPATNIGDGAYASMFENCASLEQAPQLPATNLARGCYEGLFENCINLINAPILPSTTLVDNAYHRIYRGCSALKTATILTTESPYGWGDYVGWNGVVYKNPDLQELRYVPTTWQVADYGNNVEISTEIPNYFYIEPSIGNDDVEIRFEEMDATFNNSFLSYYDGIGKWKMLIFENGKSTIVINKKTYFTNLIIDWRHNANNEHTLQIIFNNDCKIGGDFTSLKTGNISVIELNLNDKVVDMSNLINYNS